MAELGLGWREGAILVLVILAGYMGYTLYRLSQMRAESALEVAGEAEAASTKMEYKTARLSKVVRAMQGDIRQLQHDLEHAVREVQRLDGELAAFRRGAAATGQVQDALRMAGEGYSQEQIAEHLGMSVGEVQLMLSIYDNHGR